MTGKIQPKLVQELEPEETEPKPATDALEHKETTAAADNAAELHTTEEQLDEDEREFRAMRRDLPGVKGASAAGIVAISVGKTPTKNEFFRTHPTFRPIVPIVDIEVGMEKQVLRRDRRHGGGVERHRHHRDRSRALPDGDVARRDPHRAGAASQRRRRAERI